MTRENKLALVVGFALILFVGILISDHFSTARSQESADLTDRRPLDPLLTMRRGDPELLELRPPAPPLPRVTPAVNQTSLPTTGETPTTLVPLRPEPEKIEMGGHSFIRVDEPIQHNPPFIFHHVQRGETLASISRQHYGDASLAKELARFNDIADPNVLRVNHRLRIPAAETLRGSTANATASTPRSEPAPTTYTVQPGDSLSDIAQRLLGSSRRWREIHEMNRDVIRDPDNVVVGTELKIPRR